MDESISFGQWLRQRRRALDLTQEELARLVGYSVSAIRKTEAGTRRPSRELAEWLSDVLRIPAEERAGFSRLARGTPAEPSAPTLEPKPRPESTPPNNLPTIRRGFVGREDETAELQRLLCECGLVTVTGSAGVGKSTLAMKVALDLLARHPGDYPDGLWLVQLAALADPSLVPPTVARVLGLREAPDQPIEALLLDYLRSRQCLLVLDNAEHLLSACSELAETLLRGCPRLSLLVTSREPLRIGGETVWRLQSLEVPPLSLDSEVEALGEADLASRVARYEAVELFVLRAKAALPRFSLTPQNASAVAEICRRLDGIPLALELAAARVTVLSPAGIASRLDDRFHLLTLGSRTALPRHRTLRSAIDWSYDLLADDERALFSKLGVFAGAFSLGAVEAVGTGDGTPVQGTLDLLSGLVDKSLVVAEAKKGETCYRLLETLREYALEKLIDAGEEATVRKRHLDWYFELAQRAEREERGPRSADWLDRLEDEHDNLRAALAWCLEHDVQLGLELVGSLIWFWDVRCYFREGWSWATALLARDPSETIARAKGLRTAGYMADGLRRFGISRELYREALELARRLGDRREVGRAALWLGRTEAFRSPDTGAGTELFEEALVAGRETEEAWLIAEALAALGMVALELGNHGRGRRLLEESLALNRESGFWLGLSAKLWLLGHQAMHEGDLPRARACITQSLAIRRAEGGAYVISAALSSLGALAVFENDLPRATALLDESLTVARQLGGNPTADGRNVWLAGLIAVASGEHVLGVQLLSVLDATCRQTQTTVDPLLFLRVDSFLKCARASLGEEEFARAWAEGQAMTLEQAVESALLVAARAAESETDSR